MMSEGSDWIFPLGRCGADARGGVLSISNYSPSPVGRVIYCQLSNPSCQEDGPTVSTAGRVSAQLAQVEKHACLA